MAVKKTKRTAHLNKAVRSHFPECKGKILEDVEFSADPGYNCIELKFQDNTALSIEIEPGFTLAAYFSSWKSGEQRILRSWPLITTHAR